MKFLLFFIIIFIYLKSYCEEISVNICADNNPQFPYIFSHEQKIIGVYPSMLEIISQKLKNKYKFTFNYEFMPWKRCLEELKSGKMDGALTASYKPDRAEFLFYPEGSDSEKEACGSNFKINCNEHVIVTLKKDHFTYEGDPKSIPLPVRATRGYSVVDDLKKEGLIPEEAKGEEQIMKQLERDHNGSAIVTGIIARELIKKGHFKDNLEIQKIPFIKKSYYLPFSKKTKLTPEVQQDIWNEISIQAQDENILNFINEMHKIVQ